MIPIDQAQMIVTQPIEYSGVVYAALGVAVGDDTTSVGGALRLGTSVQEVQRGGVSYKAGLKADDTIVGISGE